jgi:hypothetical protein
MSDIEERIKDLRYYVVGGQAFEGSLNDGDTKRLTDCDLLLANAKNLYDITDSNGYILVDILSFLTSSPIRELVPQDIIERLMRSIDLTVMALAIITERLSDVPAIMEEVKISVPESKPTSTLIVNTVKPLLTHEEMFELSAQHVEMLISNGNDVTNIIPLRQSEKIDTSGDLSPYSA